MQSILEINRFVETITKPGFSEKPGFWVKRAIAPPETRFLRETGFLGKESDRATWFEGIVLTS